MALIIIFPALAALLTSAVALAQTGTGPDEHSPSSERSIVIVPVRPIPGADLFKRLDSDGDGYISKDEAEANNIHQNFEEFDTDKDGEISAREFHIFAMTPAGEPPRSLASTENGIDGLLSEEEIAEQFNALDTNHDGFLSRDEADAERELMISDADKNGDDRLDLDEYKDAHRVGAAPGGETVDQESSHQMPQSF